MSYCFIHERKPIVKKNQPNMSINLTAKLGGFLRQVAPYNINRFVKVVPRNFAAGY